MNPATIAKLQAIAAAVERYGYCALTRSDLDMLNAAVALAKATPQPWTVSTGAVAVPVRRAS